MNLTDTIVAVSSAAGAATRMIVRGSGPNAFALLRPVGVDGVPPAGSATRVRLAFDGVVCPAWLYVFAGPRSYTGEDSVEWHLPGSPLLARMLIDTLVAAGARPAEAGEFTARAFFNGRLDLAAAEGVALTLAATQADELAAARRMLAGEVSRRVDEPLRVLADTLALLEANLDFSEEDIAFVDTAEVCRRADGVAAGLDALLLETPPAVRHSGVPTFALVGLPNAGKSTLLNALAGDPRAVASPVAGTTRDVLSIELFLAGGGVRVVDSPGLGPSADHAAGAAVAAAMQERAGRAIDEADFLLHVRDATAADRVAWLPRAADMVVWTKTDLLAAGNGPSDGVAVSAQGGVGLDVLRCAMNDLAFAGRRADALVLTARQAEAIAAARRALGRATVAAVAGPEVLAQELRTALDALGEIRGVVTPDDVLGRVFAGFCIGK